MEKSEDLLQKMTEHYVRSGINQIEKRCRYGIQSGEELKMAYMRRVSNMNEGWKITLNLKAGKQNQGRGKCKGGGGYYNKGHLQWCCHVTQNKINPGLRKSIKVLYYLQKIRDYVELHDM